MCVWQSCHAVMIVTSTAGVVVGNIQLLPGVDNIAGLGFLAPLCGEVLQAGLFRATFSQLKCSVVEMLKSLRSHFTTSLNLSKGLAKDLLP